MAKIVEDLKIPDAVQDEVVSSGKRRLDSQINWARFYLAKDGLVDSSKRGVWSLSARGRDTHLTLTQAMESIARVRKGFAESKRAKRNQEPFEQVIAEETGAVSNDYKKAVLDLVLRLPPAGFERLCQRVLRESGFAQVEITGRSGDDGIDGYGTLSINPLVSFKVLFQCKRYSKSVAPTHVRDFRGAMAGRAEKGIILTTGTFTVEARREASRDGVAPIELIDGEKLVQMLETLELGLKPVTTYELDLSFFTEFEK